MCRDDWKMENICFGQFQMGNAKWEMQMAAAALKIKASRLTQFPISNFLFDTHTCKSPFTGED